MPFVRLVLTKKWSHGDIDCLGWDMTGVNVQDMIIDDVPRGRRVNGIVRGPVKSVDHAGATPWT